MSNLSEADAKQRMVKSIDSLTQEFARLRTGRAHPSLLEHVMVDSYGTDVPLNQVASIAISDPRTLLVTPWDKNMVAPIEKAILNADLGLNPMTAGQAIRVPMPALTEERRKQMVKVVRSEAETARVAIRNVRRDFNQNVKNQLKNKEIGEDDQKRLENSIQKLTDQFIKEVDELLKAKEADLLEI